MTAATDAAEAPDGFVAFLDAAAWLAERRPMPRLAGAVAVANAVRARRIAAIYRAAGGRWAQVSVAALDAEIDLETGQLLLPDAPGAGRRAVMVNLAIVEDEHGDWWEGDPPSSTPEPRPDVRLVEEPWEELRHSFSAPKHQAIWAAYHERNRAAQAALDAWREREDKRKADRDAYERARREHEERPRRLTPPVEQIEIIGRGSASSAGIPLYVAIEDVRQFAAPPAQQAFAPVETDGTDDAGQKRGRPYEYDVMAIKLWMKRWVIQNGMPASKQIGTFSEQVAYWAWRLRPEALEQDYRDAMHRRQQQLAALRRSTAILPFRPRPAASLRGRARPIMASPPSRSLRLRR